MLQLVKLVPFDFDTCIGMLAAVCANPGFSSRRSNLCQRPLSEERSNWS